MSLATPRSPSHAYGPCAPEPEPVNRRSWYNNIWDAFTKSYTPSVITMLTYLLATALLIGAMIFDDITIPRLITAFFAALVYCLVVPCIYFDVSREHQAAPSGNTAADQLKKLFFAKVKYHGVISTLAMVMVVTTMIVEDDVLTIELLVTFALMAAVLILGGRSLTQDATHRV